MAVPIQIQTLININITILHHYVTNYVEYIFNAVKLFSSLNSHTIICLCFNLNRAPFNSQDSVQPVKVKEEGLEGLAELVSFGSGQLRDEQEDGNDPDYQVKVTKIHLGMIRSIIPRWIFGFFLFSCKELCTCDLYFF